MKQALGFLLALTSVVVLSAQLLATAPARVGPPAVCFPFDVGEDTIPEAFDSGFKSTSFIKRIVACLDESERTLVHMETLRSATMVLMSAPHGGDEKLTMSDRDRLAHELVSTLRWRLVEGLHSGSDIESSELGQLWFDLAFTQGALSQALRFGKDGCETAMNEAMVLLPKNASAQFGCALAMWEYDELGPNGFYPRMRKALDIESAGPSDPDLMKNILRISEIIVGATTRSELEKKVNKRLAGK